MKLGTPGYYFLISTEHGSSPADLNAPMSRRLSLEKDRNTQVYTFLPGSSPSCQFVIQLRVSFTWSWQAVLVEPTVVRMSNLSKSAPAEATWAWVDCRKCSLGAVPP